MAAKFEIRKDHAGEFPFHLKAPKGEIIAASQGYETRADEDRCPILVEKATLRSRSTRRVARQGIPRFPLTKVSGTTAR